MSRIRVALISNDDPSAWASCRTITPNLRSAYESAFGDGLLRLELLPEHARDPQGFGAVPIWNLASELVRAAPQVIAFSDHHPHPEPLLRALFAAWPVERTRPLLVFHLFGDFSLQIHSWLRVEPLLREFRVRFVCASERHHDLVAGLVRSARGLLAHQPFPVRAERFAFDSRLRERTRARLGFADDEVWCLYSGRISLQKNVDLLAEIVSDVRREFVPKLRLAVAGAFDDLGAPMMGVPPLLNSEYQRWSRTKQEALAEVRWLGTLPQEELSAVYAASDFFASFSLHHDEDYGMAPAEALAAGLPCVLTDWGGYAGFRSPERTDVRLVSVRLADDGLLIGRQDAANQLEKTAREAPLDASRRAEISRFQSNRLGVPAAATRLLKLVSEPAARFCGFNSRAAQLARVISAQPAFPSGPVPRSFYSEIYESYVARPENE